MNMLEKYKYLLEYPEFNKEDILKRYTSFVVRDKVSGEREAILPVFVFDISSAYEYIIHMYSEESLLNSIEDLNIRKERAMDMAKVPDFARASILNNDNPMISDMVTRYFRMKNNFDYELLESGREAIAILLDVVRTPISKDLEDDKARNAAKAKRECYEDAQYIIKEIKKLQKELFDKGNQDIADNVTKSAFKVGVAESLLVKERKS